MQLNEEQMAAATHPPGEAALILAGAGAGKTASLTRRISWLIEQGVPPRKILALTFTNKAANEIAERVARTLNLPEGAPEPRITTIHSLALSMIRRNPEGFGLRPRVTPLDDYDQTEMLKEILVRMVKATPELAEQNINIYNVKELISYHRARGVGFASDYTEDVHQRALVEHAGYHALSPIYLELWKQFSIEKGSQNVVDFDDMVHLAVERSRRDEVWREALQKVFHHVLMDEAQDTNLPCWNFVNMMLGPDNRNLCVIGDTNQSIYSFNGAQPKLIMEFAKEWRGAPPKLYRIVRNHPSVPQVVKLANDIQAKMTEALPLQMESYREGLGHSGKTRLIRATTPRDIAIKIAETIDHDRATKQNFAYRDYCILMRSGVQLREIEGEMVRARIPYVVRGGRGLLQTEEVRDILSYVRLATNPNDFAALKRSASAPKRGAGDAMLEKVRHTANEKFSGDLVKAARTFPKLAAFADLIQLMQERTDDPVAALDTAVRLSSYIDHLRQKYRKEPEKVDTKMENLTRLREMIQGLSEDTEMSTEDLIFQLTMDKGADEADTAGKVTISTIHAAKGLEWNTVWVTNVHEGSLPHKFSVGSEDEVNEERRLFYVAVTRARDTLGICVPVNVVLRTERQGGMVKNVFGKVEPSRFLVELGIIQPSPA